VTISRELYQHGSVRQVPRSQGFAWEFRFYITAPDGKRKLKVQTFDVARCQTERDFRRAVEGQLLAPDAGTLGSKHGAIVRLQTRSRSAMNYLIGLRLASDCPGHFRVAQAP
jgi:hypothetical protein